MLSLINFSDYLLQNIAKFLYFVLFKKETKLKFTPKHSKFSNQKQHRFLEFRFGKNEHNQSEILSIFQSQGCLNQPQILCKVFCLERLEREILYTNKVWDQIKPIFRMCHER